MDMGGGVAELRSDVAIKRQNIIQNRIRSLATLNRLASRMSNAHRLDYKKNFYPDISVIYLLYF